MFAFLRAAILVLAVLFPLAVPCMGGTIAAGGRVVVLFRCT